MEPTPTGPARSEMFRLEDIVDLDEAEQALREVKVAGVAFDSRKVRPGDVFFAVPGAKETGVKYIGDALARGAAPARAAARLFPRQPQTIAAVTGTSGKTSVTAFTRQIWQALGFEATSLGTIGVVSRPLTAYGSLTTPDPIGLHETLSRLAEQGVTHAVLEASSHGLDQKRLDGVRLSAGAFTNLTRDHMDYHATAEDYLAAKLRLFRELLAPGAPAVIDADSEIAPRVQRAAVERGLSLMTVGPPCFMAAAP